jgi:hypothetical protein
MTVVMRWEAAGRQWRAECDDDRGMRCCQLWAKQEPWSWKLKAGWRRSAPYDVATEVALYVEELAPGAGEGVAEALVTRMGWDA